MRLAATVSITLIALSTAALAQMIDPARQHASSPAVTAPRTAALPFAAPLHDHAAGERRTEPR